MQVFLVACLVAVAAAGRLENVYLPPAGSQGAGGSGGFLASPFKNGGSSYNAPAPFSKAGSAPTPSSAPSGAYGAPGGGHARSAEAGAQTLRFENNNDGLGSYSYQFETENRIQAQETGELRNAGTEGESLAAHGSYSYTAPDGTVFTVTYTADENGFHASGDHLPTPPPIPEAILRSIELNEAEEAAAAHSGGAGNYNQGGAPNRGYLGPSQPSFNSNSGYKY